MSDFGITKKPEEVERFPMADRFDYLFVVFQVAFFGYIIVEAILQGILMPKVDYKQSYVTTVTID